MYYYMNDYYFFDKDIEFVLKRLALRKTTEHIYSMQLLTLNCGSSEPDSSIKDLLDIDKQIYAIALQEFDTDPQVLITNTSRLKATYLSLFG